MYKRKHDEALNVIRPFAAYPYNYCNLRCTPIYDEKNARKVPVKVICHDLF